MTYLKEMMLGKGGENMSFEYWQELESSPRIMLEKMTLSDYGDVENLRWRIVKQEIQKMNFTNKQNKTELQNLLPKLRFIKASLIKLPAAILPPLTSQLPLQTVEPSHGLEKTTEEKENLEEEDEAQPLASPPPLSSPHHGQAVPPLCTPPSSSRPFSPLPLRVVPSSPVRSSSTGSPRPRRELHSCSRTEPRQRRRRRLQF
ncbi:hypothetical protein M0R45_025858 [Rubus argutus]|uniref:Uncharacterized protein n=1 Tax=Rubus argutus TaxID=59490 RepID=A0AAW1WXE4_RUBAR